MTGHCNLLTEALNLVHCKSQTELFLFLFNSVLKAKGYDVTQLTIIKREYVVKLSYTSSRI
jgi:hypothetical protein